MGLGMARPGAHESSLPPQDDEDIELMEDVEEPEDGADEAEAADQEAQEQGYADSAERTAMETEARQQGWRPLAEYRGKPGGWKTAKAFIEAGQNYLPFVQKELRESKETIGRMGAEMDGLRTEMAKTAKDMQKLLEFSRKAGQVGYDRAVKDLKDQQREAVAAGDTVAFDKIEGQLDEMAQAREEAVEEPPAPEPQPRPAAGLPQEYQDFIADNPWFNSDRTLHTTMIAEHNAIIEESPAMPLYDQLEKAKEAVMARHPKKFGLEDAPPPPQPRRPAAPLPPRGGAGPRPPAPNADLIEAIADPKERAEARAGYARAKASMPNLTKAEYMAVFSDPHGDVLETVQAHKAKRK